MCATLLIIIGKLHTSPSLAYHANSSPSHPPSPTCQSYLFHWTKKPYQRKKNFSLGITSLSIYIYAVCVNMICLYTELAMLCVMYFEWVSATLRRENGVGGGKEGMGEGCHNHQNILMLNTILYA